MSKQVSDSIQISDSIIEHWRRGVGHFNQGLYWEAHQGWEKDWIRLPFPVKQHVQALIISCGVFCHLKKGRKEPALALCRLAQLRWVEAGPFELWTPGTLPVLTILGLPALIHQIQVGLEERGQQLFTPIVGGLDPWKQSWEAEALHLRAELHVKGSQ